MKVQRSIRSVEPLSDDVIMEILTRMPAHDVLKCRGVCRKWRALISTQHFQEMHLKAKACHSLMILVQKSYVYPHINELLLLDKWEQPRKRPTICRDRAHLIDNSISTKLLLSYDGLICFYGYGGLIIMNPISGDVVRVDTPRRNFDVFGMFFNQWTKEYCILLDKYFQGVSEFQILNLGAQPCCRALQQPLSFQHKPRKPPSYSPPVVIDNATIYWLVGYTSDIDPGELIMAFDVKTEVFTFLPHPDPTNDGYLLGRLDLHIINGRLSLVQVNITQRKTSLIINIWALKDASVKLWIKTHNSSIDIDRFNIPNLTIFSRFKVMAFGKGELLLQYSDLEGGRIYAYSFELGTLRKIGKTYKKSNFCIYVPSFVSLRDCKPKICI